VTEDWKYLSSFIEWVDTQPNRDWHKCQVDKDFLSSGNKHYSPETVVFIPRILNTFITDRGRDRGKLMIGVTDKLYSTNENLYISRCGNPFTKKREHLGVFTSEINAHLAWKAKKHEHACRFADMQDDLRVANRLRTMYSPETDWTNR
jgi:hypothetical protein